jgi:acyl dehydratase
MLKVGQKYIHKFCHSQKDVIAFSEVTGDKNPIHLDSEFAAKTQFKRTITHGMLSASIFSKVFGTIFPGNGTIYLNQSLNFLAPIFIDIEYEAIFEVVEVDSLKKRATISTIIVDNVGFIALRGEATIMNVVAIG